MGLLLLAQHELYILDKLSLFSFIPQYTAIKYMILLLFSFSLYLYGCNLIRIKTIFNLTKDDANLCPQTLFHNVWTWGVRRTTYQAPTLSHLYFIYRNYIHTRYDHTPSTYSVRSMTDAAQSVLQKIKVNSQCVRMTQLCTRFFLAVVLLLIYSCIQCYNCTLRGPISIRPSLWSYPIRDTNINIVKLTSQISRSKIFLLSIIGYSMNSIYLKRMTFFNNSSVFIDWQYYINNDMNIIKKFNKNACSYRLQVHHNILAIEIIYSHESFS
ncbi:hypothetical protein QTP88_020195 [Uroleucon formosanum]